MIRKTYSALALLAVAGMVMVGCGKEDLTEMDTTWGKKDSDVVTKLDELKTKNEDLTRAFETLKTANIADTAKAGDRALVDQMLKDHQTAIGEIEKDVNDLKAKREEALKTGKKADYEAAWKDAEAKYEAISKRIDELQNQNGELGSKVTELGNAAPAATTDTAATGTVAKPDTATAAKAEAKKPAETAGKTEVKADEKKAATPATESGTKSK